MNGNPAVDVFNGLKLAAGGELGIGVGEEEWGSGEREVLEDFIRRTDGLVDLIVSRFGDAPQGDSSSKQDSIITDGASGRDKTPTPELQSTDRHPTPSDGVIFSGIGAVTKHSVKSISSWVESLHMYGQDAYGIQDNPSSARRRDRRKPSHNYQSAERKPRSSLSQESSALKKASRQESVHPAGIPAPIVGPVRLPSAVAADSESSQKDVEPSKGADRDPQAIGDEMPSGTDTLMKYLTLGVYGSKWGIHTSSPVGTRKDSGVQEAGGRAGSAGAQASTKSEIRQERRKPQGYFMIGLQGELDQDDGFNEEQDTETGIDGDSVHGRQSWSNRTILRTLQVERAKWKAPGWSSSVASSGM